MSVLLDLAKKVLPPSWKRSVRRLHRRFVFQGAMRRLAGLPADADPPGQLLSDLVYGWGNESFSALHEYITAFLRAAARTAGPILECGSGLSTLLLGMVAQRTGQRVWSLEHQPCWAERVRATLRRHRINRVEVCLAPLRDYGPYTWYDPPPERLPADFALVVCDGPPGDTPGGRYGLLPVLRRHLRPGCVVMLDDVNREGEKETIRRWSAELGVSAAVAGSHKPYGTLTIPGSAT
jgi:predicted O-methyltransferase YrrM